ncbi:MAG: mandelate racemase/muconate lactonizing enzyme family protein, partial [Candidatus Sumerlaeota bacterium]|nr:mandelate racemase/muconate lactonizing enzyme family protein [Candidatus Sumerlaeota bacterium]
MKITKIRVFSRQDARPPWIFVKAHTDEGMEGLGEATSFPGGPIIVAALKEFEAVLLGKDPLEIEKNVAAMVKHAAYLGADGACMAAISGIEMALWDLVGKTFGCPVYQMLGGRCWDTIPLYANAWFKNCAYEPDAFAERAAATVKKGFAGIKFDPFSDPANRCAALDHPLNRGLDDEREERALRILFAVRKAVGDSVKIAIDAHGRFDVATAIRIGKRIEPARIFFYEEPTEPDNFDGMKKVASALSVPICAGERYYGRRGFARYIEENVLDIIMPDVCRAGGVLEMKKIAACAETHGIALAPHNPNGPVGSAAALHVAATCPNTIIL